MIWGIIYCIWLCISLSNRVWLLKQSPFKRLIYLTWSSANILRLSPTFDVVVAQSSNLPTIENDASLAPRRFILCICWVLNIIHINIHVLFLQSPADVLPEIIGLV
jgi:hypothetical protein